MLAWIGALLSFRSAHADEPVSAASCTGDVCVFNVVAPQLVSAPCEDMSVLVVFSKANGTTLIQCSAPGSVEENQSIIFDRRDPGIKPATISGGRFVQAEFIATAAQEGIPDRFGAVPLCAPGHPRPAITGELVVAEKRPNETDDPPYCYVIIYAGVAGNAITLQGDSGKPVATERSEAGARWAKLRQNLTPYIEKAASGLQTSP